MLSLITITVFINYYVTEVWLVAGTYFSTQNIKPRMYLWLGRLQILETRPVAGTYFSTQNTKSGIYLRPGWS